MVPNRRTTTCERCGGDAVDEVVPDGWDDAPANFTITRTCKNGPCSKTYTKLTAQQMHDLTGLPLSGWSS